MEPEKKTKTIYKYDLHLVGGTVMYGVTVEDFTIFRDVLSNRSIQWVAGGTDPLTWVSMDHLAGVVLRDTYEVEVDDDA